MTTQPSAQVPSRASAVLAGVLTLAVIVAMVNLGLWQLRRHDQVREQNLAIAARSSRAVDLAAVDITDPDEADFQRITARGTWRPDQEVLWRGRSRNGVTGFEVLTPLELVGADDAATGAALLVDRGWVSANHDEVPVLSTTPPDGIVTVTGILRRSVPQPNLGPRDPDEGNLTQVFHADLARLEDQVDGDLLPMYLRLEGMQPPMAADLLRPLAPIEADAGPHLGYALQWFSFSLIGLVAYLAWLRAKVLAPRRRARVNEG